MDVEGSRIQPAVGSSSAILLKLSICSTLYHHSVRLSPIWVPPSVEAMLFSPKFLSLPDLLSHCAFCCCCCCYSCRFPFSSSFQSVKCSDASSRSSSSDCRDGYAASTRKITAGSSISTYAHNDDAVTIACPAYAFLWKALSGRCWRPCWPMLQTLQRSEPWTWRPCSSTLMG